MSHRFQICAPVALLTFLASPVKAQPASFQGPVAGFVFSSASKTVRPLLGLPGSTRAAAPILNHVDAASIAPGGKWALITRARHATLVGGLSSLAPVESSVDGLIDPVDRIAWSRDGSIAVLYSSSGNLLQRVDLSGSQPVAGAPVDVSTWGQVTTLAIDPAGQQIAAGFATSGLYLFPTGQSPALLSSMAHPQAAAFDGTGQSLFVVDPDNQRILQFQSGSAFLVLVSLAQPNGPPLQPAGLAVSADGRYLLMPDSITQSVLVYEISSGSLANTLPLNFAPSRFEALSAGPVFLLNGNNRKEWLLVLDASQTPAVYFVPAGEEEAR
jgi:hypothetical protein